MLLVAFFLGWLSITLFIRKHINLKEAKRQILFGVFGLCVPIAMEIFAVTMGLWTYYPANWPVILWPTYFIAILFAYQLIRLFEKIYP
jgi:uncharacterized membrane protein YoaT (DUF817 family)